MDTGHLDDSRFATEVEPARLSLRGYDTTSSYGDGVRL